MAPNVKPAVLSQRLPSSGFGRHFEGSVAFHFPNYKRSQLGGAQLPVMRRAGPTPVIRLLAIFGDSEPELLTCAGRIETESEV